MLHLAIAVGTGGIQGSGLFAQADILAGELIWRPDPKLPRFHVSTINSWPPEKRARFYKYSIQIAEDWHLGYEDGTGPEPWTYLNHCCDPTTWWGPGVSLVARRRLRAGEEVTFDYATSEIRPEFRLLCSCGSPLCRGLITPDDYRNLPEMRARFGAHVLPHVMATAVPGSAELPSALSTMKRREAR